MGARQEEGTKVKPAMQVPYRALTFMAHTGRYVAQSGLSTGIAKAASKANPALLVLEAAVSVMGCAKSYLNLASARKRIEGLSTELPMLEEQLKLERETLSERIQTAQKAIEAETQVRTVLVEVVSACKPVFSTTLSALALAYQADLPELDELDSLEVNLMDAWTHLKQAFKALDSHAIGINK